MMKSRRLGVLPLAAAVAVVAVTTIGVQAETERAERSSDVWIEATIFTSYLLNDHLSALDIDVEVTDGIVALSGEVDSGVEKDLAYEIAAGVEGVKNVDNGLSVVDPRSGKRSAKRERSAFARLVADASTTARVKSRLVWNSHTDGLLIDVDSDDGVVVLGGTVESAEVRALAAMLARNTIGVTEVRNELRVDADSRGPVEAAGAVMRDVWITTKIETTLLFDKRIDSHGIDVSTANGVVKLEGEVDSRDTAQAVVELVRDVVGVKDVESELHVQT